MSGQDIVIPVFCLTNRAGKISHSCPLRISHVDLASSLFGLIICGYNKFFIDLKLMFVQDGWIHFGFVLFLCFYQH